MVEKNENIWRILSTIIKISKKYGKERSKLLGDFRLDGRRGEFKK